MYYTLKVAKQTRGERYTMINLIFNSFTNVNVLDMSVTAVIFVTNKCIANFLDMIVNTVLPKCNIALARTHNFARDFKNRRGVATVLLVRQRGSCFVHEIVSKTVATPLN